MVKRALIVGINYVNTANELHGCINDAKRFHAFLKTRGYADANVRLITDESMTRPTASAIVAGLQWLTMGARLGDTLVFYYSGHGYRTPDRNGDEADGMDEMIISVDNYGITDDLVRALLVDRVPVGVRLFTVFDSCHSGSMCDLLHNWVDGRYVQERVKAPRGMVFSLSACLDSQQAEETVIDDRAQGIFTHSLLDLLTSRDTWRYRDLRDALNSRVKAMGFRQASQLSMSHLLLDSTVKI